MMQTLLKVVLMGGLLLLTDDAANAQKPSACPPVEKAVQFSQVSSVTGCPFSAVIENETTQTLADGTHIQNTVKVLVYRDSFGRIRYESYAPTPTGKDAPESLNLIQVLDPVAGFGYFLSAQNLTATRARLTDPATNSRVNVHPRQSSLQDSTSKHAGQQSRPDRVVEMLGAQIMEGVLVTGSRDTVTIPVGEQGNDRPIQVVSEVGIPEKWGSGFW